MSKDPYHDAEQDIKIEALKQQNEKMSLRISQLTEQYKNKEKHLLGEIKRLLHIEESARNLCQKILDKDRREMVLGTNHSWSSVPSEELIATALKSYKQYCEKRTKDLQKISKYAEKLGEELDAATKEIKEKDFIIDTYEKNKTLPKEREKEIASLVTGQKVDSLYKNKNIEVSEEEEEPETQRKRVEKAKTTHRAANSTTIRLSEEEFEQLKIEVARLHEYIKEYIIVIGNGYSDSREIKNNAPEKIPKGSSNRLLQTIRQEGYVDCVKGISFPNSKNAVLYFLTEKGKGAYKIITGKDPKESELSKIIAFHDNAEHGYGIKECAKLLETCGKYRKVDMFASEMKLPGGGGYRPDIVAEYVDKEGTVHKDYFEYERCTQETKAYFEKFTKMALITDDINIIVCTPDEHRKMLNLVSRWITALDAGKNVHFEMYAAKRVRIGAYNKVASGIKENKPFEDWWILSETVGTYNQKVRLDEEE